MKKGKEIHVELHEDFKAYYGTIDNKELKSIYCGVTSWITPVFEDDDYTISVNKLRRIIKSFISKNINPGLFATDIFIVDVNVKDSRIQFGKRSYLNIEITLYTKNVSTVLSEVIRGEISNFLSGVINLIQSINDFQYSITKVSQECISNEL